MSRRASRAEGAASSPTALLARLARTSPLARLSAASAVLVGLVALLATVAQAVALAHLLAGLFADAHRPLGAALVVLVAATATRALLALAGPWAGSALAAPVRRDLRRRALTSVLEHGPGRSPDAATLLLTRGTEAVEDYLAGYVPAFVLASLAPVGLLVWMVATDWLSALIVAVTLVVLPVFMVLLGLEASAKMRERWAEQARLAGYFGDVMAGMATLKAHRRSRAAMGTLSGAGEALADSTMSTLRVAFLSSFALELLSSVATALVALVLGLRLLNGSVTLSSALAVLVVTPEVYLPLRKAAARFHGATDGVGAAEELLDLLEAHSPRPPGRPVPTGPVSVALKDARAVHADRDQSSLLAATATVPAGSTLVVQGPSGVGKSTLLAAVAGLSPLAEGRCELNGVDVSEYDAEALEGAVAWLGQEADLPGATVREALRLGRPRASDAELRAALDELGLDLDLDLVLGPRAANLSAGQRRRLALARTLLRPVGLLVLDEPTAHLDPTSEALAVAAITRRAATKVVATHRDFPGDVLVALRAPERFGA